MKRQQGSLSNVDEINNNDDESNHSSSSNGSTSSTGGHSFYHVMVPLTIYATVFSVQAFLVTIPDISPTNFLIVTFVGLAICGTCGAIATAGIISTAGLFPSHIGINPFFSGQSLGGVVVSMANFGAAAVGEDPVDYLDKHCNSTNQTQEIIATYNSIMSTEILRMDSYLPQEEPPSCSPYAARDWAVFSYFLLGCIILIFCLVGYHQIHMYQNMKHRDDYETLHNHEQHELALGENYNDNVVEVDETSARIGLEMNDRIYQRELNQNEQGMNLSRSNVDETLMITSTSEQSTNIANDKLTSNDENSMETLTSLPDDIPTAEMTASSSNITCLPSLCGNVHSDDDNDNYIDQDRFDDEEGEEYTDNLDTKSVFFAIKGPVTCVFLTFTVTLTVFPSYISDLKSSHECENHIRLYNDLYIPLSFVLFNVGDLIGRILAEYIPVDRIKNFSRKLVACAILRIALVPLFLMCLTTTGKDNSMVIRSDIFSLSVQLLFAITNGLFVSTSFMWSPQLVGTTTSLQERASETMTLALYFGLLCGSFLAFPFMQFATRILE
jgi:hypothetical protein